MDKNIRKQISTRTRFEVFFDKSWRKSIERFIEQLGYHEVLDAMEIASSKIKNNHYAFKYFCGICWNKIKQE